MVALDEILRLGHGAWRRHHAAGPHGWRPAHVVRHVHGRGVVGRASGERRHLRYRVGHGFRLHLGNGCRLRHCCSLGLSRRSRFGRRWGFGFCLIGMVGRHGLFGRCGFLGCGLCGHLAGQLLLGRRRRRRRPLPLPDQRGLGCRRLQAGTTDHAKRCCWLCVRQCRLAREDTSPPQASTCSTNCPSCHARAGERKVAGSRSCETGFGLSAEAQPECVKVFLVLFFKKRNRFPLPLAFRGGDLHPWPVTFFCFFFSKTTSLLRLLPTYGVPRLGREQRSLARLVLPLVRISRRRAFTHDVRPLLRIAAVLLGPGGSAVVAVRQYGLGRALGLADGRSRCIRPG